jgi:glycosyltransferase involved in cell wall biosynthesis
VTGAPSVSVLVAVHDGEGTVRTTIESVLRQTVSDLELVVVDDGSRDRTPELLESVSDPRLVRLRNEERLGLAASLNRALELARGRYLARLDADDLALPRRLERQLARLRGPSPPAVLGSAVLELAGGGRLGPLHEPPAGRAAVRWHALFGSPFFHPTVVVDRAVLDAHRLRYDPAFEESEDYDLWTRLLAVADGENLREPLVLRRVHPGQASKRREELQRSFQRRVAMREIGRVAPGLSAAEAELAWRAGSGAGVAPQEAEAAAEALALLFEAFARARAGEDLAETRHAASRAVARLARSARGSARGRLSRRALGLDPVLPARLGVARARRRRAEGAARARARALLRAVGEAGGPVRVALVSPEPTPYRAPLLDRIAQRPEVELTVVYAARTVAGRRWTVEPAHRAVFLDGVRVPGARRVLRHDYPVTPGVFRALRGARPEVVVVNGWSTFPCQAAIAWSRAHGVPYLLLASSHDAAGRPRWRRALRRPVVPPIARGAWGAFALGTLSRESLAANGVPRERIRLFANTVDVAAVGEAADRLAARRPELRAELGLEAEDVAVLSAGRLVPEKGFQTLVRAVAEAADPRLALVVAGAGPLRGRLAALARDLGVRLRLTGELEGERLLEAYVAADVFALLSTWEPWGVVVNEAAACAKPLVLSEHVGAAADLLREGENGLLVPPGDVAAAAAVLRRLAAAPELRSAFGARSRELVSGWGYEPSVDSFVAAVCEAAGRDLGGSLA